MLAWPDQVGPERYSHPFDAGGWVVAQLSFALQHLLLLVLVLGLARLAWRPRSWLTRSGLVVTAVGLVVLTGCELFALTAASAPVGSPAATAVDTSYGLPMTVLGVGLLLAGVGSARRGPLPGRTRWLPLVLGGYVFAVLVPAVFGTDLAGRLAIGGWMLLFAVLGWALVRVGQGAGPP
ncbi:hypothetical protein SAMN04488543_3787 [Friedmanniella luteola]|uniref:Uncharacterized protein n=1 Tax=Friedmanniella luteola TaxID=546871 RepID=A0A1H1ZHL7_9ACTN|nr:hypothetical protein SAMN04488543_3787 [Friedmanniella luteola]